MKQVSTTHGSMAYIEACDQKPSSVQYLQGAIIQLLNDHIPYNETLQVLGVLCITVDGCADEVVLKVNSTLKRINSLTPPKERSPDLKSNSVQLKNGASFDSILTPDVLNNVSSPFSLDASHLAPTKSRGRKQSKPAKVRPDDYNVTDCTEEVEDDGDKDLSPVDERVNCSRKRSYSIHNDIDGMSHTTFEVPRTTSYDVKIKREFQDDRHYSPSGLDLSILPKKSVKLENGCFAMSSNCDDEEQVVSTSILQSAYSHNQQRTMPSTSSRSHFVAFLKQSPRAPAHSTSSPLYRKILPAGSSDFKSHLTGNLFLANNHINHTSDIFEIKNEDDYLLDCLNSDGKKRRRRSLEDALTPDEMLEYMGSRDNPETAFGCRICGEVSPDLLKYFHHTLSSHKAFICHQCGRCFTTKSSLLRHRPIHTGLRRFACGICHKAFYRKDKCKAHIKKHAEVQEEQDASYNLQVL